MVTEVSDEAIPDVSEEDSEAENVPATPPATPDIVHPVLTLKGDEEVFVDQMEKYKDDGASCMDDRDGILFVKPPEGIAKVKTEEPTQATSPFVLIYTCVDKAGNEADSKTRRVHVRDACAEASQQTGQSEKLCLEYDPPVCSAYGSCATVSPTVTKDEPVVAAFEPEVDTEPPKLALVALNSESKLARTTSGKLVMAESIVQGQKPRSQPKAGLFTKMLRARCASESSRRPEKYYLRLHGEGTSRACFRQRASITANTFLKNQEWDGMEFYYEEMA